MLNYRITIVIDEFIIQVNEISMLAIEQEKRMYTMAAHRKTGIVVTEDMEEKFFTALRFYLDNKKVVKSGK